MRRIVRAPGSAAHRRPPAPYRTNASRIRARSTSPPCASSPKPAPIDASAKSSKPRCRRAQPSSKTRSTTIAGPGLASIGAERCARRSIRRRASSSRSLASNTAAPISQSSDGIVRRRLSSASARPAELVRDLAAEREPSQVLEVFARRRIADPQLAGAVGRSIEDLSRLDEILVEDPLRLGRVPRAILELPVLVLEIGEPQLRFRMTVAVVPLSRGRVEAIEREQLPSFVRDQVHRLQNELKHLLRDEVVEVHAHPAGLDAFAALQDLALELARRRQIDPEQSMT